MTQTKINLGITQETLLIPLWARAIEQQQINPIIRDSKSAEILQSIDYDFEKFSQAKTSQIGTCLRGLMFDHWVRSYLREQPQRNVIEIGAGLNTRFERVDNGEVHWFDLDLPDVMVLRQQFFQESDRRQVITASALDTDWIDRVKTVITEPVMFVAEGVLMYFTEQQVKQLLANLVQHFPGCWFAFDSISPLMMKHQKHHDALKYTSAAFTWSISDIWQIEAWDSRYKIQEVYRFCDSPSNLLARYYRRFSLIERLMFSLPGLNNAYRLALVQIEC